MRQRLPSSIVVHQQQDDKHPEYVAIDHFDVRLAAIMQVIDPGNNCAHCWAKARLLFYAGLTTLDDTYTKLSLIRDDNVRDNASGAIQRQVDAAAEEVGVELRVTETINTHHFTHHFHDEPPGNH